MFPSANYLSRALAGLANCIPVNRRRQKLSEELERTVWRKLFVGLPTETIASELSLSISTVESIMRCHSYLRGLRSRSRNYRARMLHRQACTEYFRVNPMAYRNEFRLEQPKRYIWLYRHDKEWLNENLPKPIERASRRNQRRQLRISQEPH